jgi:hypothetical protein
MRSAGFQVDILLSYRQHEAAGACCYVTVTEVTPRGQFRVIASQQLSEHDPLRIVDSALARAREASLEHYLAVCEPF